MSEITMYRDWRGMPVEVGCRVIYPVRRSASVWMVEAEVLEVRPHGSDERRMKLAEERPDWAAWANPPEVRFNLVVRRISSSRRGAAGRRRRVHLKMTLWVTVIEPPHSL